MFPLTRAAPAPLFLSAVVQFARAEDGAVAVDWVVLSAAIVGLGTASTLAVGVGLETLSTDISAELAGVEIEGEFANALEEFGFATLDFSGDAGGWTGGDLVSLGDLGDVYQIAAGDTAELSVDLPSGTDTAVVEFDLFGLDTLNNEPATISVNGQSVGAVTVNQGFATYTDLSGATTSWEVAQGSQGTDLTGNGHGDASQTIRITVEDPGTSLDVEVHSGAHADVSNESFAIDNFTVSAS